MTCPSCSSERVVPIIYGFISPVRVCEMPPDEPTSETCPNCGEPLVIVNRPFGKVVGCSTWPDCDYRHRTPEAKAGLSTPSEVELPPVEAEEWPNGQPGVDWIGGGCNVYPGAPSHACLACGHQWLVPEAQADVSRRAD